jgi:hypothetical protein
MHTFQLDGQVVTLDAADVETMRQALIGRLAADRSPNSEICHALAEELKRFSVVDTPYGLRLGPWVATDRDGQLALVRIPGRSAVNYIFVAKFDKSGDRWAVTDIHQETMRAR